MPDFKEELKEIYRDQPLLDYDQSLMDFIMGDDYLVREGDDLLIQNMIEEMEADHG